MRTVCLRVSPAPASVRRARAAARVAAQRAGLPSVQAIDLVLCVSEAVSAMVLMSRQGAGHVLLCLQAAPGRVGVEVRADGAQRPLTVSSGPGLALVARLSRGYRTTRTPHGPGLVFHVGEEVTPASPQDQALVSPPG